MIAPVEEVIEQLSGIIDIQPRDKRRFKKQVDESKSIDSVPIRNRLTDEEVALFTKAGAQVALLGRPIFRSAHAGMAALSGLNAALRIW